MPFENLSPFNREAALSFSLRGRRLIFEVGLDEAWYESAAQTFRNPISGQWLFEPRDLRRYPATLAVLLAAAGTLHYREGNLWSNLGLSGPKASLVGQAFGSALRVLRLETFDALVEDEKALRYLTPILAHGGIPRYCLSDFFRLLVRTIRHGSTEPQEILSLWATRKSLTQTVDKPAIRFILHGGEPAADFLQRCVDLVLETRRSGHAPSATELGLPQSLVDAFAAFESEVRETVGRDVLPRPYVQLDPWDGLGPTLELPPAEMGVGPFEWRVRDERHIATYRGSHNLPQTVRLNPARHWEIESRAEGREPRTSVFECFDSLPALFFDPGSGRLLRSRDQLRVASVWTLHHRDVTLSASDRSGAEQALAVIEELPQPSGLWSGCQLSHYSLVDVKYLVTTGADSVRARVPVAPPALRPALNASLDVMAIRSSGGAALYSQFPILTLPEIPDVPWERWRVTARSGGNTCNVTADRLERSSLGFSLEPLLRDWTLQEIYLAVRGPLGSDLTSIFAVVPGLVVERPGHVLLPSECSQIRLRCDRGVQLGPHASEESVTLRVAEHVDQVRCQSRLGSNDITLLVAVPRLRWALSRSGDTGVTSTSESLVIDLSEVAESTAALVISTGVSGISLRLRLRAGPKTLQTSDWISTSATGRLFFNLARFRDTVVQGDHGGLELVLDVGGREVRVARLVTKLEVQDIRVTRKVEHGRAVIDCRFTDGRAMKSREVRIWSLDRPWNEATIVPIPDGNAIVVESETPTALAPGRYLAEVALSDPWNSPVRPLLKSSNTAAVTLGRPDEIEDHRRRISETDPLGALELAISTGRTTRSLTETECLAVAAQAVEAACWQIATLGTRAPYTRSFHYLVDCFTQSSKALVWSASMAIEKSWVTAADLLRLAIVVVPLAKVRKTQETSGNGIDFVLSDSMLRNLWSMCPPLAAVYDVPSAVAGDTESVERCEEFLGVQPGEAISVGAAIGAPEWHLPAVALRDIHRAMELRPVRLFDLDALAEANFEWLLAEREGRLHSSEWCAQHGHIHRDLPISSNTLGQHMASRRPTYAVDEGMKLPRRVLGAAVHIAVGSPLVEQAVQALLPLVNTVPKLLNRDITLAIVFVHTAPGHNVSHPSGHDA